MVHIGYQIASLEILTLPRLTRHLAADAEAPGSPMTCSSPGAPQSTNGRDLTSNDNKRRWNASANATTAISAGASDGGNCILLQYLCAGRDVGITASTRRLLQYFVHTAT